MSKNNTYEGVIMIRGKGTGFVSVPDHDEDIVIPREKLNFALNGDVVEIELKPEKKGERREGKVLRVIEPRHHEFIGVVEPARAEHAGKKKDGAYRLLPDNRRIHIRPVLPNANEKDVGMKVVVKIVSWKQPNAEPLGEIAEIIGKAGEHETEMQAILRSGGFSEQFPPPVQEAARALYEQKDEIFKNALKDPKRKDFRTVTTFTIDPVDAKDFDDALSIRVLENGLIEVGIHIADVSHYVREGDAIDMEARERGTSIYLVDRVIPMLPEVLSNNLCSLRPHEDRLAFSAVFTLDTDGNVKDEWYGQSVIHSDKRFSYEEAQEVLDTNAGPHLQELSTLMAISRKIRKRRYAKGAIAFEQPEVKFELDEKKRPIRVYAKHRTETMMMIEDYMLLANRKVAEYVHRLSKGSGRNAAFVYRIHDLPDPEKIEELEIFLRALGYEFEAHKGIVKATDINTLLEKIEGTPEESLIKTATIRSMAKAVYSTKNIGHFGLAFKFYTHFTSPIRRYPDLMAHRMLRRHLDGSHIQGKELAKYEKLAIQSSERELTAVSAERDSIKFKQVEYMQDKVGQEFNAIISGVAEWGIYVEEKESKAEGLIRLASMKGDYFQHEPSRYRVKGERTGTTYTLGDEVRVRLTGANLEERQLDFELIDKK